MGLKSRATVTALGAGDSGESRQLTASFIAAAFVIAVGMPAL